MIRVSVRLGQLVALVVLLVSGTYLLVYLYRWEWNRALVAGLFFVATEVALFTSVVLRRLAAIDRRLDTLVERSSIDEIRATAPPPTDRFRWLEEQSGRMQVFVPVLLGAGVVLSLIASAVERLAGVTARPALERRLAMRLDGLALPAGGLVGLPLETVPPAREHHGHGVRIATAAFLVAAGLFLGVLGVDVIADATQDRPDPPQPGHTELTMSVERRFTRRSVVATAEALFVACRHTIGHSSQLDGLTRVEGDVVRLEISPAIGRHATRRFVGCLEDALFDRVSADVQQVARVG